MHQERIDRVRKQKIYDEEGEVCVERLVRIRDRSQRNLNISTPLSSSSQYGYQTKCESTTNLSRMTPQSRESALLSPISNTQS